MADKLTDTSIKAMAAPASGNRIVYDETVKGFGVRITAAGARAFILNYRAAGRERRYTIGSFPDWTTSAARDKAKELKREVDNGGDPMGERHEQRAAPTMTDLARLYRETHMQRKRPVSQRGDEQILANHILPPLGKLKVVDVRRTDVAGLHRNITKTAPIAANRCMALLSKMFAIAIVEEWRADNPCQGVERNPENRRERFLTPAEIARLADALAKHKQRTSADALRLLLLTGARRGETLAAKWTEFDVAAGVWIKPSAHTKSKKSHRVPLSAPAMVLLTEMQASAPTGCTFLFPASLHPSKGEDGKPAFKHLLEVKRTWAAVTKAAGIEGVRLHDLRHTYASILASAGLSLPIIGALLGHTQAATTQRYSHLMDDPLRAATERVGAVVAGAGKAGAVGAGAGKVGADVVPMRRGA